MKEILCFECGQSVGDPPTLNYLSEDEVCPSCSERLLNSLPAPLPSAPVPEESPKIVQHELPFEAGVEVGSAGISDEEQA